MIDARSGTSFLPKPLLGGFICVLGADGFERNTPVKPFVGPDLVTLAAPGEALVTIYPGDHYAAVWGTSFSAALVSAAAIDLLSFVDPNISKLLGVGDVKRALSHAGQCDMSGNLGAGCIDFDQAEQYLKGTNIPH